MEQTTFIELGAGIALLVGLLTLGIAKARAEMKRN